ncbi:helix-turn-helix domain-containing protein [Aureimonas mangrovi]|uniref:helix-turn-helix domain-containing protein n=1 Tax=Aureimonas mangrovi TaxID=2758041 RepID=UPI00163D607B|nr:helix-turn-helix domain-containing protein [Aureimonas mangrovi]
MQQTKTVVVGNEKEDGTERVARWTEIMSEAGNVSIVPDQAPAFTGSLSTRPIGDLLAMRIASSTFRLTRDELLGADNVFVNLLLRGSLAGTAAGRNFELPVGGISLVRRSSTLDLTIADAEWFGLAVPLELFERKTKWRPHLDALVFAPHSMQAVILRAHLLALTELADPLPTRVSAQCEDTTLTLLANCIDKRTARPRLDEPKELQRHVRRFILDNLSDPDLGWSMIADEFALSRSSLYRTLGAQGDVAAMIRRLRLRAAHRQIVSTNGDRTSIRDIGLAQGFVEERTFRRAFAREFGYSPAALRSRVRAGEHPRDSDVAADLKRWFDRLSR